MLRVAIVSACIALLVLAGVSIFFARTIYERIRGERPWGPHHPYYEADVLQQSRRSEGLNGVIAFIGDSQISGFPTWLVPGGAENFGIVGDKIDGTIYRLAKYDFSRARAVVVEIGINDWAANAFSNFGVKYAALLRGVPKNVPVIAMAIMPLNRSASEHFSMDGVRNAISKANSEIQQSCKKRVGCQFVDLTKQLSDADGELLNAYEEGDGLHLSRQGYAVWLKGIPDISGRH